MGQIMSRAPLEEVTSQLDDMLRLSFETSFSFSLAAIIFKGLRRSALKESAEAALRTLLQVTADSNASSNGSPEHETLGYYSIALLPASTTPKAFRHLLKESKFDHANFGNLDDDDDDGCAPHLTAELLNIGDSTTALLVASFVASILSTAQRDNAETEILYGLFSTGFSFLYPDITAMTYAMIFSLYYTSITSLNCVPIDARVASKIESRIFSLTRQIHPI
jgi:hypothetical protein